AIPAGLRHDPLDEPGVASMVAGLLLDREDRGRAAGFTELGATLSGKVGESTLALHCVVTRGDAPAALRLLVDAVRSLPTDAASFERVRSDRIGALETMRGSPRAVAGLGVALGTYGVRPPTRAMATGTPASLRRLSVGRVRQWHASRAEARGATFAVAGAASLQEASQWVNDATARWPGGSGPRAKPAPPVRRTEGPRVVLIPWPESQQCTVAFGGGRIGGGSADADSESAADAVLTGVINQELRARKRLTYGSRTASQSTRFGAVRYNALTINPYDVAPALHPLNTFSEWVSSRVAMTTQDIEGMRRKAVVSLMNRSMGPQLLLRQLLTWADRDEEPPSVAEQIDTIESLTLAKLEKALQRLGGRERLQIAVVGDPETIAHARGIVGSEGVEEHSAGALIDDGPS
ncbi:MAG: insulinase family protein, partial [Myxococcota bacterium]